MSDVKNFIAWAKSDEAPEWVNSVLFAVGLLTYVAYMMSAVALLISGFPLPAGLMILLPLFLGLRAAILHYKKKGPYHD